MWLISSVCRSFKSQIFRRKWGELLLKKCADIANKIKLSPPYWWLFSPSGMWKWRSEPRLQIFSQCTQLLICFRQQRQLKKTCTSGPEAGVYPQENMLMNTERLMQTASWFVRCSKKRQLEHESIVRPKLLKRFVVSACAPHPLSPHASLLCMPL